MLAALVLLLTIAETPFQSSVDQALGLTQNRDWNGAMALLDRAWTADPVAFDTNNLHYLRGRIAEEQKDWARATDEFAQIGPKNPLRPLAVWHAANAAMRLGAVDRAIIFVDELPADFPAELKLRLAREAPPALALRIVNTMTTREARLRRALILNDVPALWTMLRQNNSDDVALEIASRLEAVAAAPREWRDLAAAFLTQRQFPKAVAAYERLRNDSEFAAEARYQLARVRFLSQDYAGAYERYKAVAAEFPGTEWGKNADYQVGNSLWRQRLYKEAEQSYLDYIKRNPGVQESAVRDLADIYRSLGEHTKAITLIDATLKQRVSAATRQVLLFTKAKILYSQEKYTAALQLIQQLKGVRLQSTSNGTSAQEIAYLEALGLEKTGRTATAKAAWTKLASDPNSYYGQRAAEKAGLAAPLSSKDAVCSTNPDPILDQIKTRLVQRRRVPHESPAAAAPGDAVEELLFLQLWDEAAIWLDRSRRPNAALAADASYVSGRYNRAILYADRLGPAASAQSLAYPPAFRASICQAAAQFGVDPLWLHAIIWQESRYDAGAQSAAAARGLMQFIPDTAQAIANDAGITNLTLDRLYDPDVSIRLGAFYWSTLMAEFKSPELALAAYNGGPDNVRRWKDKWPNSDGEFFVSDIGFTETKRYVQAVFGARAAYGRLP